MSSSRIAPPMGALTLQGSEETIPLDLPRITDDDLEGIVPGRRQKQDLQFEELNGAIIPVNLAGSEDRENVEDRHPRTRQ